MIPVESRAAVVDRFARVVSLAVRAKINLNVIGDVVSSSSFACNLDHGAHLGIEGTSAGQLFEEMFPLANVDTTTPGTYDDAYWCGWAYMQLFFEYRKPIPYLVLVMPLPLMMQLYPTYHEMDVSQLFERFEQEAESATIMSRLLARKRMSSRELGERSGVSVDTINHYRKSDEHLYRAGFQQAYRLAIALQACPDILLRETL